MKVNWGTVGNLIGKAAPIIGGLVGGPVGASAGALVSNVLGCENTPEAVEQELKANPEAYAKLKAAQLTHKKELAELAFKEKELIVKEGIDHRKIDTADARNARERDSKIRESGQTNTRANWMIIGDVVGLIACLATLFMAEIGEAERAIIITFGSYFGLGLRDAHSFEFGSSRGSKEKDGSNVDLKAMLAKFGKS